jgi:hypothetical protein
LARGVRQKRGPAETLPLDVNAIDKLVQEINTLFGAVMDLNLPLRTLSNKRDDAETRRVSPAPRSGTVAPS